MIIMCVMRVCDLFCNWDAHAHVGCIKSVVSDMHVTTVHVHTCVAAGCHMCVAHIICAPHKCINAG